MDQERLPLLSGAFVLVLWHSLPRFDPMIMIAGMLRVSNIMLSAYYLLEHAIIAQNTTLP